jgi:hypothetical protein
MARNDVLLTMNASGKTVRDGLSANAFALISMLDVRHTLYLTDVFPPLESSQRPIQSFLHLFPITRN